jgi:hypothetical protein
MKRGDKVTALLFGGGTAERRVVADKGDVIVICAEEEYLNALEEGRDPEGVGFPKGDIVESEQIARKKPAGVEVRKVHPRAEAGD